MLGIQLSRIPHKVVKTNKINMQSTYASLGCYGTLLVRFAASIFLSLLTNHLALSWSCILIVGSHNWNMVLKIMSSGCLITLASMATLFLMCHKAYDCVAKKSKMVYELDPWTPQEWQKKNAWSWHDTNHDSDLTQHSTSKPNRRATKECVMRPLPIHIEHKSHQMNPVFYQAADPKAAYLARVARRRS